MNSLIIIIILIILVVVMLLFLKARASLITQSVKKMPRWLSFLFVVAILCFIGYFLYRLIGAHINLGITDRPENNTQSQEAIAPEEDYQHQKGNCIILRGDDIWINNRIVNIEQVESFIDQHAESGTEIIIVDDYSTSFLHHEITDICDKKNLQYRNEDEKWIKQ